MLKNIIKITLRNFRKHRGYTFINIAGLTIGLACCLLISLWILDELNYDKFYKDSDRIQAILADGGIICPNAILPYLADQVPEIQYAARISGNSEKLCSTESVQLYAKGIAADPEIIDILSFTFISGDPRTALSTPSSLILTQSLAAKLFPNAEAVGQRVTWDNESEFTVTGVIEDVPHNSSLQFSMIAPIDFVWKTLGDQFNAWDAWSMKCVVKVAPGITSQQLSYKIADMINDRYEDEDEKVKLSAINIEDVYFHFSEAKKGVLLFSAIALAILLMAAINFVNLTTARYKNRAKEVGLRKVVGASRKSLILQFLGESFLQMIIALGIALYLVQLILPSFNSLFGLHLSLHLFANNHALLFLIGFVILTSLAAGIYPSLILSRFQPVRTMKNDFGLGRRNFTLRRILVVIQFTLSVILIIGTLVVYTQINHMKTFDIGYDKEHIVTLPLKGNSGKSFDALKTELLKNPNLLSVTGSSNPLPYWHMTTSAKWAGVPEGERTFIGMNMVTHDFIRTYGFTIMAGRDFRPDFATDEETACIINESMARKMNLETIINAPIRIWGRDCHIIGIIKDFNYRPLEEPIEPLALIMLKEESESNTVFNPWSRPGQLAARISPKYTEATLAYIKESWEKVVPDHPYEYAFLDEEFDARYKKFDQMKNLAGSFAILAILIASLGLLGLAMFTAEQKNKEIGIRKVLGATVANIVRMLSREFLVLVMIANVIAWPIAWLLMRRWLQEFAYHTDISIGLFFLVGGFVLLIALLSVGFQAVRAAGANPVKTLKYE